jgi:hypothetical protein
MLVAIAPVQTRSHSLQCARVHARSRYRLRRSGAHPEILPRLHRLINPATCKGGIHDSDHIGPWSLWQGNLNGEIVIIGQDWGDARYFIANAGRDAPKNPTNGCGRAQADGLASGRITREDSQ